MWRSPKISIWSSLPRPPIRYIYSICEMEDLSKWLIFINLSKPRWRRTKSRPSRTTVLRRSLPPGQGIWWYRSHLSTPICQTTYSALISMETSFIRRQMFVAFTPCVLLQIPSGCSAHRLIIFVSLLFPTSVLTQFSPQVHWELIVFVSRRITGHWLQESMTDRSYALDWIWDGKKRKIKCLVRLTNMIWDRQMILNNRYFAICYCICVFIWNNSRNILCRLKILERPLDH